MDVPTWSFWDAVRDRLSTPRMEQLLRGAGRVRLATEEHTEPEGGEQEVWARAVVLSTATLWTVDYDPALPRPVSWLVRAEVHSPPMESQFNPARLLDAIHAEAYNQLQGWEPAPGTFPRAFVALPVYRQESPQAMPLWDDATGVWYTSSQYRTELSANQE
jgi:hypothetical protein